MLIILVAVAAIAVIAVVAVAMILQHQNGDKEVTWDDLASVKLLLNLVQ